MRRSDASATSASCRGLVVVHDTVTVCSLSVLFKTSATAWAHPGGSYSSRGNDVSRSTGAKTRVCVWAAPTFALPAHHHDPHPAQARASEHPVLARPSHRYGRCRSTRPLPVSRVFDVAAQIEFLIPRQTHSHPHAASKGSPGPRCQTRHPRIGWSSMVPSIWVRVAKRPRFRMPSSTTATVIHTGPERFCPLLSWARMARNQTLSGVTWWRLDAEGECLVQRPSSIGSMPRAR